MIPFEDIIDFQGFDVREERQEEVEKAGRFQEMIGGVLCEGNVYGQFFRRSRNGREAEMSIAPCDIPFL